MNQALFTTELGKTYNDLNFSDQLFVLLCYNNLDKSIFSKLLDII